MNPYIERLPELVRPPLGGGDYVDWEAFQTEFGFVLPTDFREFMGLYGGGVLGGWLGTIALNNPDELFDEWRFQFELPLDLWHFGTSGNQYGEESLYPVDPGVGALVFCAMGGPGPHARLFWNAASEDPDEWTIVVVREFDNANTEDAGDVQDKADGASMPGAPAAPGWQRYEFPTGFAQFLVDVLEGRIDNLLCTDPAFLPSRDFVHVEDLETLRGHLVFFEQMVLEPAETVARLLEIGEDPVAFFASAQVP